MDSPNARKRVAPSSSRSPELDKAATANRRNNLPDPLTPEQAEDAFIMVLESCRDPSVPTLGQRIHDGLSNFHDRAEPLEPHSQRGRYDHSLVSTGAGLAVVFFFLYGDASQSTAPTRMMRSIGIVSGTMAGLGGAMILFDLFRRMRSRTPSGFIPG